MNLQDWEEKILEVPGAPERVAAIEQELRVAVGLTALREQAGLSQRALARLMGISQPRVAAIERSPNVTLSVIAQYAQALGGHLEVTVVRGDEQVYVGPAPLEHGPSVRGRQAGGSAERRRQGAPKQDKELQTPTTRRGSSRTQARASERALARTRTS